MITPHPISLSWKIILALQFVCYLKNIKSNQFFLNSNYKFINTLLLAFIFELNEPLCCLLPNELKFSGVSLDDGFFFNRGSLLSKSYILQ